MEQYGRYQLLAKLATGGMAQVFLSRQSGMEGFEKLVVLKRILPHLADNDEFVRMFLQEARVAARLNHPAIAQIFDLGKVADSFFIAMEYVHGEDFRRVVRRANAEGRTLPVPLACRMVIGACEGLDFAHAKTDEHGRALDIVHRDVSPQNLLVTFEGQVKVIDFGIAKAADSASHTRTGVLKGKYSYMSPEQAEGHPVDRRSDVFALGIVLHELITQQRLFKRHSDLATLQAVIACKVPRPTETNPSIDPELEGIVMRALAKDRDERTPTAGQLALELEEYLRHHRLPGASSHLRQFMREVYKDRLAEEARLGHPLALEEPLKTPAPELSHPIEEEIELEEDPEPKKSQPPPVASLVPERSHSGTRSRSAVKLAPVPARSTRLAPPPLSPNVAEGEVSAVSRVVRQSRTRRTMTATLVLTLAVLAGAAAVLFIKPGAFGSSGRLARLDLQSEPPGAQVFVDGRPTGQTTPANVGLEPGLAHEVRLELEGHLPATEPLPAFSGQLARVVRLEPRPVGALKLETQPSGALVLVNGRALDKRTPTIASALDATKPHEVAFVLEGHEDELVKTEVVAGRMTTLRRTLKPKASAAAKVVATPTPPPVDERAPTPPVEAQPEPLRDGTLSVLSTPAGIGVQIDGREVGRTPYETTLAPGRYEVRLADPARFVDERVNVNLEAGESETVRRDLTPRKVRFNVRPYAKVYIGDKPFADSPGDAELVPGTYRVTYSCPDIRARRTEQLVVPAGSEPLKVQFTLAEGEGEGTP